MKEFRVLLALKLIKEIYTSGFKEAMGSVPGMERMSADEMSWGPTKRASSWSELLDELDLSRTGSRSPLCLWAVEQFLNT
jgi:hypothetical protein